MNKFISIFAIFIISGACVIHKSEHRKYFEENGYRFLNSSGFTFKVLEGQICEDFDKEALSFRLPIEADSSLNLTSLILPESNSRYCLIDFYDPKVSGIRSWICPLNTEQACWEYKN